MTVPRDMAQDAKAIMRRFRRQARQLADTAVERDRVIVEMVRAGGTLREVGAIVDLSPEAIRLIVNKAKGHP